MNTVSQDENTGREVQICFKASRPFKIALDMALAQKQASVQDFCFEAVNKALRALERSLEAENERRKVG